MKQHNTLVLTIAFVACGFTAPAQNNWFNEIRVKAFTSASFGFNFNNPPAETNAYRVFDKRANSFMLDVFELSISKEAAEPGDGGMRIDLVTGNSIPEAIHSAGMFEGQDVDLKQAYVSYIAPIGDGLKVDFGKFITHMGCEVIEGVDGYNDQATRSFCFGWSIPFTHTGLRLNYAFSDAVGAMLMVANGWDNSVDNNKNKTLGAQVAITPGEDLSLLINGIYGAEGTNNNSDNTAVGNLVATYAVTKNFNLGADVVFGTLENGVDEDGPEGPAKPADAGWMGFGGYLRYDFNDWFSLAFRGEQFDDTDGVRTGIAQKLTSITLTPEFRAGDGFVFRFDVRMDSSDKDVFPQKADLPADAFTGSQTTLTLNLLYLID